MFQLKFCLKFLKLVYYCTSVHGRRQRGADEPWPPWIFKHGTNIVDRGLKVPFFGLFLLFFVIFFRCPPPFLEEAK